LLAGGAEEEARRPARSFEAKLFLSGGSALRSSVVESSPSPSCQVFGSSELVNPSPASAWRLIRSLLKKKEEVMCSLGTKMVVRGVSSQGDR
jgi:hypothetical protein